MILSAQEATKTRLCAAEACPEQAEAGQRLCYRCLKKDWVRLHKLPIINPNQELRCCTCNQFKTQAEFSKSRSSSAIRNHRSVECKPCAAARRVLERARLTPEQISARQERDRIRGRLYRQRIRERRGHA